MHDSVGTTRPEVVKLRVFGFRISPETGPAVGNDQSHPAALVLLVPPDAQSPEPTRVDLAAACELSKFGC